MGGLERDHTIRPLNDIVQDLTGGVAHDEVWRRRANRCREVQEQNPSSTGRIGPPRVRMEGHKEVGAGTTACDEAYG